MKFADIQSVVGGSRGRAKHEGGRVAAGSGAQFGEAVRPVQGAGFLAERRSESRGRPPRQVSLPPRMILLLLLLFLFLFSRLSSVDEKRRRT